MNMSNIELVIKIPEEVYKAYKMDSSLCTLNADQKAIANSYLINGLINGILLPKGHGDLIDRKELLKQPMNTANYPTNYVNIAPPIIKADTEERGN